MYYDLLCVFFQYLTNIDESPAKMGGKENYWRKLTLDGKYLNVSLTIRFLLVYKYQKTSQWMVFGYNCTVDKESAIYLDGLSIKYLSARNNYTEDSVNILKLKIFFGVPYILNVCIKSKRVEQNKYLEWTLCKIECMIWYRLMIPWELWKNDSVYVPVYFILLYISVLPRHTIFYDIVDFLFNHRMTPRLQHEIPLLVMRPMTQDIQIQHIRAVSEMR